MTRAFLCAGLAALAVSVVACGGGGAGKPTAADADGAAIDRDRFPDGSAVTLQIPEKPGAAVPVAASADALEDLLKWGVEKNAKAIETAYRSGDVSDVRAGTRGEVEGNGFAWVKVRLDGGPSVYVVRNWLALAPAEPKKK